MKDNGLPEIGDVLLVGMYREPSIVVEDCTPSADGKWMSARVKKSYGPFPSKKISWVDDYVRCKRSELGAYFLQPNVSFDANHDMIQRVYEELSIVASGTAPHHAGNISVSRYIGGPVWREPAGTRAGDFFHIFCEIFYYSATNRLVCESTTRAGAEFSLDLDTSLATILGDRAICLNEKRISLAIVEKFVALPASIVREYGTNPLLIATLYLQDLMAEIGKEEEVQYD